MSDAKVEKRNRPPKSCEPCRVRKLKCNRAFPCDTCVRSGKESVCQYAPNADRNDRRPRDSVSDRLKHLESLISSLAQKGVDINALTPSSTFAASTNGQNASGRAGVAGTQCTPISDPGIPSEDRAELTGGTQLHGIQASYVDSNHWSSILEDIRGIREQLTSGAIIEPTQAVEQATPSTDGIGSEPEVDSHDLVFGVFEPSTMDHIIKTMPARHICDSLVSQYFQSRFTILPILHPVKFQQEYEEFWQDPQMTSPVWVALLFSVLSLGSSLYEVSAFGRGVQHNMPSPITLSKRTEQCLVLGRYARSERHAVETLMIHVQSCFTRAKDSDVNLWMLMGVVIRLAIRLGYHRDPSRFGSPSSGSGGQPLSPFDGEMRRRVWVSIFQIDALMSFQMGLPSMIPADNCDAELPRNLEYSDFCPGMATLPPSRPLSDYTPILYTIAKQSVMLLFKTVVNHTRSLIPPPYEKTLALDAKLRETYQALPECIKYKPLRQSVVDSPGLIMNRATIEILYLKSIIVLHRKYVTSHRRDPAYDPSRRACLEAALCICARQAEAMQPAGRLYEDRWFVSALTANDFILAAMVICLELTIRTQHPALETASSGSSGSRDGNDLVTYFVAMQVAREIWDEATPYSAEARVAAHAISSTIERVTRYMSSPLGAGDIPPFSVDLPMVEESFSPTLDGMELIDWGPLDSHFQDSIGAEIDLNSWILDAAASGPLGLL